MSDMVGCRGCAKQIHKTAPTCPHCGVRQRLERYKSKTAAGILAILLGGLGIHRFYLGQWWGIFYLLFCWLLIPGLVALVEGIVFLVTDKRKWDDKYNGGMGAAPGDDSVVAVVLAVVGVFVAVFVLGILAAIAIPAYQDYTVRAKVQGALTSVFEVKVAVAEYFHGKQKLPQSNADVGMDAPQQNQFAKAISVGPGGAITIVFSDDAGPAAGKTVILEPVFSESLSTWRCDGGTLAAIYRSRSCRGSP